MRASDRRLKAVKQGLERESALTHRIVFSYCLEAMRRLRTAGDYDPDVLAAQVARQHTGGDVAEVRRHLAIALAVVRARGGAPVA